VAHVPRTCVHDQTWFDVHSSTMGPFSNEITEELAALESYENVDSKPTSHSSGYHVPAMVILTLCLPIDFSFCILGCACASGERLRPHILYRGRIRIHLGQVPVQLEPYLGCLTQGGWRGPIYNFLVWFKKLFLLANT
jgi:hypothetical protein